MGLPWARFDTNFPTHDKVIELVGSSPKGKAAGFVYACAMAHSVGNGTDGVIKKAALPFVHGTPADAKLLVAVGLWEVIPSVGWRIKNYGTRQAVGLAQQALHETRSAAGRKGAQATWGT